MNPNNDSDRTQVVIYINKKLRDKIDDLVRVNRIIARCLPDTHLPLTRTAFMRLLAEGHTTHLSLRGYTKRMKTKMGKDVGHE